MHLFNEEFTNYSSSCLTKECYITNNIPSMLRGNGKVCS